jgi:hypothetical protein
MSTAPFWMWAEVQNFLIPINQVVSAVAFPLLRGVILCITYCLGRGYPVTWFRSLDGTFPCVQRYPGSCRLATLSHIRLRIIPGHSEVRYWRIKNLTKELFWTEAYLLLLISMWDWPGKWERELGKV